MTEFVSSWKKGPKKEKINRERRHVQDEERVTGGVSKCGGGVSEETMTETYGKDGYREKKGLRRKYLGYVEDGIWGQVRVKK